jgi:DNA-binding LacI/PurR family transcriptional regulator
MVNNLSELVGSPITPYPERAELDSGAALVAYRQLYELGHRRFAIFRRGVEATELAIRRVEALRTMLQDFGSEESEITVVGVDDYSECVAEMQRLAARPNRPTAIISANGRQTPFVLEGIRTAGLRMPEDVSFLCFGDSPWHVAYPPPLSVIRHDYAANARRSVELLVSRIEAREMKITPLRPSEFVPRGSFGPVPRKS